LAETLKLESFTFKWIDLAHKMSIRYFFEWKRIIADDVDFIVEYRDKNDIELFMERDSYYTLNWIEYEWDVIYKEESKWLGWKDRLIEEIAYSFNWEELVDDTHIFYRYWDWSKYMWNEDDIKHNSYYKSRENDTVMYGAYSEIWETITFDENDIFLDTSIENDLNIKKLVNWLHDNHEKSIRLETNWNLDWFILLEWSFEDDFNEIYIRRTEIQWLRIKEELVKKWIDPDRIVNIGKWYSDEIGAQTKILVIE